MPTVDDELTRRFHGAERRVEVEGLFEGLERRRARRETLRKLQTGMLALFVIAATVGGFVALRQAFDGSGRGVGQEPPITNGEIVFSKEGPDGRFHIYAARPDGSGVRQITDFATTDTDPAVSPDGQTIAFVHELDQGNRVIATVPIEGGPVTWQTSERGSFVAGPAWSPDGSRLAFTQTATDSGELIIAHVNSEELTTVFDSDQTRRPAQPSWSPDGSLIAFAVASPTPASAPSDLATIRPDGTGYHVLTASDETDAAAPAWSPDGSRIAFTRPGDQGDEVWTVAPDGGSEELVATAVEASLEPDVAWAPDGSALLVSDSEWIYRVDATPEGDVRDNFVQLVRGISPSWQPIPSDSSLDPSAEREPTPSASAVPGSRDIGLGFAMCDLQQLDGIDWYGDGTFGAAWTGARPTEDGHCPANGEGEYVVAADLDGDGKAEPGGMGFPASCLFCRPFATTDLNADGVLELVVLEEASSTASYSIYEVSVPTSERSPGIYGLSVAPPGAPRSNLPANEPIRLVVGGDEGFSAGVVCEGYPEDPVLVYTWVNGEVDADTDLEVHETRLALGEDGIFHVLETIDSTVPRNANMPKLNSTEPACGVDFHPAP